MKNRLLSSPQRAQGMARGLGWFSIGLGLAEVLMPQRMSRSLGLGPREGWVRAYGLREIAAGVGILRSGQPEPFVWARVAGDAADLSTLALQSDRRDEHLGAWALAVAAVVGVTALDVACARALGSARRRRAPWHGVDYSQRSGLPASPDAMRGAAADAPIPDDMRIPPALRPYANGASKSVSTTSNSPM